MYSRIHGKYESVRNRNAVIDYLKKYDKNYLSNLEEDFNVKLQRIAESEGIEAGMKFFVKEKPEKVASSYSSVLRNLKAYCNDVNMESWKEEAKFGVERFVYPEEMSNWISNEKDDLTLVLIGTTGLGKTEGTITLLTSKGYNPLMITDINGLKKLRSNHMMDDIYWIKSVQETLDCYLRRLIYLVKVIISTSFCDIISAKLELVKCAIKKLEKNLKFLKYYFYPTINED